MDEIKEENNMNIVPDGYPILVETDEEDMQPTVSGQKSHSEVNLFMDEFMCVCASVCVCGWMCPPPPPVNLQCHFYFRIILIGISFE